MVDQNLPPRHAAAPGSHDVLAQHIGEILETVRTSHLHVHAITSPVSLEIIANGLSALGVRPSLTVNLDEIEDFILSSDAVLLNLGMLDRDRFEVIPVATRLAAAHHKPFVLDPVYADRSPLRRSLARAILEAGPTIIKLNQREAEAFAKSIPASSVTLITGAVDRIRLGKREARLANGHVLMESTTATGCLLGAILAACIVVTDDAFHAAIAGVSILNIAAEIAADGADGPGSFAVRLIDALAALDAETIHRRLKIEGLRDAER